jgi:hypothetical protein
VEGRKERRLMLIEDRTVFKADPKKEEVKVAECVVLKLEPAPEGKGVAGLWATELRVYMDFGAIHMKGKELMTLAKKPE